MNQIKSLLTKCLLFLFITAFSFFSGCRPEGEIPQTRYERVWLEYHETLFQMGLQKVVTNEEKINLLDKICTLYVIPNIKFKAYIFKTYPFYYVKLFKEEKAKNTGAKNEQN